MPLGWCWGEGKHVQSNTFPVLWPGRYSPHWALLMEGWKPSKLSSSFSSSQNIPFIHFLEITLPPAYFQRCFPVKTGAGNEVERGCLLPGGHCISLSECCCSTSRASSKAWPSTSWSGKLCKNIFLSGPRKDQAGSFNIVNQPILNKYSDGPEYTSSWNRSLAGTEASP